MIDTRVRRRDDIEEIARATDPFMSPNHPTYQFLNRFPVFYEGAEGAASPNMQGFSQQRQHQRRRGNDEQSGSPNGPRFATSTLAQSSDLFMVDSTASTLTRAPSDTTTSSCGTSGHCNNGNGTSRNMMMNRL